MPTRIVPSGRELIPTALLAGVLCLTVLTATCCGQQATHVFRLEYRERGALPKVYDYMSVTLVRPTKEPDFGDHRVVRGRVPTCEAPEGCMLYGVPTCEAPESCMLYAFDKTDSRLYLDLNGNLDLTDDPAGVYAGHMDGDFHVLEDVRLHVGRREYLLDVAANRTGIPYAIVRSGWEAVVELDGRRWRLAVVDDLDGEITALDAMVLAVAGEELPADWTRSPYHVDVPKRLSLGGRTYDLDFVYESAGGRAQLVARFTELDLPTGELEFAGTHFKRLRLLGMTDPGLNVTLLDFPVGSVSIPAGKYWGPAVYLDGGASCGVLRSEGPTAVSVVAGETTVLNVGAPLRNTLLARRSGRIVRMDYRLLGVGGEKYVQLNRAARTGPRFAVRKGKLRIASGSFEYG